MKFIPQSIGPIHFIGIGGIGMSGIADILLGLGYQIQGSDLVESPNVERLRGRGIPVSIGHDPEHLGKASVVVISSAVQPSNPELQEARRKGLPIVKRAEMLAEIMRLRPCIAIGGTHGKTTTTSLTASLLETGGLDPTVVSGGIINAYGTNARLGKGEWVVVEADESDGTFVRLPATMAVITNIEADHMEHYKTEERLLDAFYMFAENVPFYGLVVMCSDQAGVRKLMPRLTDRRVITYGFDDGCDIRASNLRVSPHGMIMDLDISPRFHLICPHIPKDTRICDVSLSLPGEHNVLNSMASIVCALEAGMEWEQIRKGLSAFGGVGRRFTRVGEVCGAAIIDDYAHHPTEIRVVLKTARSVATKRVIAVVQPHRYSRLDFLFDDFVSCFDDADDVILAPVYGAGEEPIEGVTHERLAEALALRNKNVTTVNGPAELMPLLAGRIQEGDIVLCMGAGSITRWAKALPDDIRAYTDHDPSAVKNHGQDGSDKKREHEHAIL